MMLRVLSATPKGGPVKINDEVICTWPKGRRREVAIRSMSGGRATIVWNERVDMFDAARTAFEQVVPVGWLSDKDVK